MKIYVSHRRKNDYFHELYIPLRNSILNSLHEIILPHENSDTPYNSKELIPNCDLLIAEISYPATGVGMELAWAHAAGIPIICIFKEGVKPSRSTSVVSETFLEYKDPRDMVSKVEKALQKFVLPEAPIE